MKPRDGMELTHTHTHRRRWTRTHALSSKPLKSIHLFLITANSDDGKLQHIFIMPCLSIYMQKYK